MTAITSKALEFDDLCLLYHETLLKIITTTSEDSKNRQRKLNVLHAFMNIPDLVGRGTEIIITPGDTNRASHALLNAYSSLFYATHFNVKP